MTPSKPPAVKSTQADHLEQRFVFRLGRMVPLALALVAGAVGAIALVVMLGTYVPPTKAAALQARPEPAAVVVTAADVAASLKPAAESRTAAASDEPAADTTTPPDAVAIARKLHGIRALLAEADMPWESQYRVVCTSSYGEYCFARERRLSTRGASGILDGVLELYNGGPAVSFVRVADAGASASYVVNYSGAPAKIAALEEARGLLAGTAAADRRTTVQAWADLRAAREKERQGLIAAEQQRIASERAAAEAAFEAAVQRRQAWRAAAITTTGIALGTIITLAMLLGILAIERNTRALRERAEGGSEARGVSAPPVPVVTSQLAAPLVSAT